MYKMLIVEDNEDLNEMFKIAFKDEKDFEIITVPNGIECLEKMDEFRPNVLLLDIMMPKMDGYKVMEEILKNKKFAKTTIVVNTNLEQQIDEEKILAAGAHFYLRKSEYAPTQLVYKIKEIVSKKKNHNSVLKRTATKVFAIKEI